MNDKYSSICLHKWVPTGTPYYIWSDNRVSSKDAPDSWYFQEETCFVCGLTKRVIKNSRDIREE